MPVYCSLNGKPDIDINGMSDMLVCTKGKTNISDLTMEYCLNQQKRKWMLQSCQLNDEHFI